MGHGNSKQRRNAKNKRKEENNDATFAGDVKNPDKSEESLPLVVNHGDATFAGDIKKPDEAEESPPLFVNHGLFSPPLVLDVAIDRQFWFQPGNYWVLRNPHTKATPVEALHAMEIYDDHKDETGMTDPPTDSATRNGWLCFSNLLQSPHWKRVHWRGATGCGPLSRDLNLHTLRLSNTSLKTADEWDQMVTLIEHCPLLEDLSWSSVVDHAEEQEPNSSAARDKALFRLCDTILPALKQLRNISLYLPMGGPVKLALLRAASSLPALTDLSASRCWFESDEKSFGSGEKSFGSDEKSSSFSFPATISSLSCGGLPTSMLPRTLRSLTLQSASDGWQPLVERCPALTELDLQRSPVGGKNEAGFQRFFAYPATNRTLIRVQFESHGFRLPATITALAEAVVTNHTLRSFYLWHDDCFFYSRRQTLPAPKKAIGLLQDALRFYNHAIWELHLDAMNTDYGQYLGPLLARNRRRSMEQSINWIRLCLTLAFVRANAQSSLRHSVIALLPIVASLVDRDAGDPLWKNSERLWKDTIDTVKLVKIDRFLDTRFAQNSTQSDLHTIARTETLLWSQHVGCRVPIK